MNTPRTDDQIGYKNSTSSLIRIEFVRQLETELNEARELIEMHKKAAQHFQSSRDAWRKVAEGLEQFVAANHQCECDHCNDKRRVLIAFAALVERDNNEASGATNVEKPL
jgi:hypothetical protein